MNLVSRRAHGILDYVVGALLIAERVWLPQVILGSVEIGAVAMTRTFASELHTAPQRGPDGRAPV